MFQKSIATLEFDKIINMASEYSISAIGKECLQNECISTDADTCRKHLEETEAAESIISATGYYPVPFFPDIRNIIKSLSAVYALDAKELLQIATLLKASRTVKHLIEKNACLQSFSAELTDAVFIENEIGRCIISEDEIADKASSALYKIRCDITTTEERIKDKIGNYIKGSSQKYLQEPIITMRNGRYVIPVKAEYKSYFPGLIHDQSATGQTFYIEPAPVVELGNQYRTLLLEEQKEIQRILSALTSLVAPLTDELFSSINCLGYLDSVFAKASLAKKMGAVKPNLNTKNFIHLINARHPLLNVKTVVPVSVWIGQDYNTLIITGPNTGGKTVSLKTVGLLCLMAQSGYFIPADFGSELPVFKGIYADIGDEQSIEQSLSTFSSHMKNIVTIVEHAEPDTLILLDELGAGTDPSEGAALAQAILEYLNNSGAITFATTHYSEIKSFAMSTPGMENASMEFDVEKMMPTYRMHIGIPGRSNAFEISLRLGISKSVIERAKEFLTTNEITLEEILAKAEKNRLDTERILEEANLKLEEAKKREADLKEAQEKLNQYTSAHKSKAKEEAREIIRNAKAEADSIINDLRDTKGLDSSSVERKANRSRSKLRDLATRFDDLEEIETVTDGPVPDINVGCVLFSTKLRQNVHVLQLPDIKNEVLVQVGSIKTKLPITDLRLVIEKPKKIILSSSGTKLNTDSMKMELDLRGTTVDDACMEIERYIDMCRMHGRKEFVIIHGKGTGALREGVHSYLRRCKLVSSFHIGAYGEGDAGVTIVNLKSE